MYCTRKHALIALGEHEDRERADPNAQAEATECTHLKTEFRADVYGVFCKDCGKDMWAKPKAAPGTMTHGGVREGAGRPRKGSEKRRRVVALKLTEVEYALLEAQAEELDTTVTELARARVFGDTE